MYKILFDGGYWMGMGEFMSSVIPEVGDTIQKIESGSQSKKVSSRRFTIRDGELVYITLDLE